MEGKSIAGTTHTIYNTSHIDPKVIKKLLKVENLFAESFGFIEAIQNKIINTINYRKLKLACPDIQSCQ